MSIHGRGHEPACHIKHAGILFGDDDGVADAPVVEDAAFDDRAGDASVAAVLDVSLDDLAGIFMDLRDGAGDGDGDGASLFLGAMAAYSRWRDQMRPCLN